MCVWMGRVSHSEEESTELWDGAVEGIHMKVKMAETDPRTGGIEILEDSEPLVLIKQCG